MKFHCLIINVVIAFVCSCQSANAVLAKAFSIILANGIKILWGSELRYSPERSDSAQLDSFLPLNSTMSAHIVTIPLCLSSQPEGTTSEEEAVHLSEEGIPGSGSGSRVVGINPRVNGSGSIRPLQPRDQNYFQGMTPFRTKYGVISLLDLVESFV